MFWVSCHHGDLSLSKTQFSFFYLVGAIFEAMIAGILRRQKTVSAPKTPDILKKKKDDNAKSLSTTMKPDHDDDGMKSKFIDNEFD